MKASLITLAGVLCAGLLTVAAAEERAENKATPKGGRLLETTEPRAEFVVEKDRSVTINFYNDEMKPVPASTQVVTAYLDGKAGRTRLDFEKKGSSLVSKTKLPDGEGQNVVVQFKQSANAK